MHNVEHDRVPHPVPIRRKRGRMKTSARNALPGSVTRVEMGAVNAEVGVAIGDGQEITAIVTNASARSLGLAPGVATVALVKASSVVVLAGGSAGRLSARNCLPGTISAIVDDAVEAQVSIALDCGPTVHAVITEASRRDLELKVGMPASAVIQASSFILALPA
jgi:molybdate transport system regulatory protein